MPSGPERPVAPRLAPAPSDPAQSNSAQSDPGYPRRILLFTPSAEGGIAHCAHYQAEELQRRGIAVTMLCSTAYPWRQDDVSYRQLRLLPHIPGRGLLPRIRRQLAAIGRQWRLAWRIVRERADLVLLEANTEYYALAWAWPHLLLRALGVTYLATFHDPVRQVRYGLPWLHRLELWLFYRTLSGGLIHSEPPREAWIPHWLRLEVVPHGPFLHQARIAPPFDLRTRLGIGPDRFVLLAFGLICDYKNLDLLIAALPTAPRVELVVAGRVKSARERDTAFYRAQAEHLGVADRLHIVEGFIPEDEVAAYFAAADAVALTYSRSFVSQSGVLQLATLWEKPVLASGGEGPLGGTVLDHDLGVFVEPDSPSAVAAGLQTLCSGHRSYTAQLRRYTRNVSWAQNIDGLLRLINQLKS